MHFFSYINDQVLYNQFSPYFLCRVSWLPIITNLGSLSQIRLNEYQLKSISFNYNMCGIWKIFNNTRQRKYGLMTHIPPITYFWRSSIHGLYSVPRDSSSVTNSLTFFALTCKSMVLLIVLGTFQISTCNFSPKSDFVYIHLFQYVLFCQYKYHVKYK